MAGCTCKPHGVLPVITQGGQPRPKLNHQPPRSSRVALLCCPVKQASKDTTTSAATAAATAAATSRMKHVRQTGMVHQVPAPVENEKHLRPVLFCGAASALQPVPQGPLSGCEVGAAAALGGGSGGVGGQGGF